jgi:hypothetical protein
MRMFDYGEMQRAPAQKPADGGAVDRRSGTARAYASASGASLNRTQQPLMQLRAALDGNPDVQALQRLERALNRTREPEDEKADRRPRDADPATMPGAAMAVDGGTPSPPQIQKKPNATGLPDRLKDGVENLSGLAMDDVRVHYNSPKPATVQAHAYAQGTDIHIAPGQERHLAHEAWHVVQQKQGRVKATPQMKDVAINDDAGLEAEADAMGRQAWQNAQTPQVEAPDVLPRRSPMHVATGQATLPAQLKISYAVGGYRDESHLIESLNRLFAGQAGAEEKIRKLVDDTEKKSWSVYASTVFKQIVEIMEKDDYVASFAVVGNATASLHGPQLPSRDSRDGEEDTKKAMSSFNFPSVTLSRAVLSLGKTTYNFHDRSLTCECHAEDGIFEQINSCLEQHNIDADMDGWKFNLTINNFPCAESTTKKSDKADNCLDKIIAFKNAHKKLYMHLYFKNTYGDVSLMGNHIRRLQDVGILVTSFATEDDRLPYSGAAMDPASDSDDEDEESGATGSSGGLLPVSSRVFALGAMLVLGAAGVVGSYLLPRDPNG